MALSVSLPIAVTVTQTSTLDVATGSAPLAFLANYVFSSGTSAYQGTAFTSDNRTLAGGATDAFDLAGGLVDIFGNVVTFTRIRAIIVESATTSLDNLRLFVTTGGNSFVGPRFTNHEVIVGIGAVWVGVAPDEDGWPVVAGTPIAGLFDAPVAAPMEKSAVLQVLLPAR